MTRDDDPATTLPQQIEDQQSSQSEQAPLRIPPLIEQAWVGFRRDLPQLLRERPGQWVAYHGDKQIGFAKTDLELHRERSRRGIEEDEFLVLCIEPEVEGIIMGPWDVE